MGRRGAAARRLSAGSFADNVWEAAKPPTSTSWIQRVSADLYYLWQPLGGNEYVRNEIRRHTAADITPDWPGADDYPAPLSLGSTTSHVFAKGVTGNTDPSVVRTGTWTGTTTFSSVTPGDRVTWTTPANTVAISCVYVQATNRGFGKVIIDGDPTRANRCDTAQEAVTAGTLPSAALVANGGTLQPTDRVLDFYVLRSAGYPQPLIADGLTAGVHTVVFEATGYKRAAATEARCISPSTFYYIAADFTPTTSGVTVLDGTRLRSNGATQESAYNMRYNSVNNWCGGSHGNMTGLTEAFKVDGSPVTMTNGQVLEALTSVELNTTSTFHHEQYTAGVSPIANNSRHYTIDENGLRIEHSTEWLITIGVGLAAYPAMLTLGNDYTDKRWANFSKAGSDALTSDVTLSGENEYSAGESSTIWLWTPANRYVAVARMANAATSLLGWVNAQPKKNLIWNRTTDDTAKAYWTLKSQEDTMPDQAPGTIWAADTTYRWAKVTDADAIASRP